MSNLFIKPNDEIKIHFAVAIDEKGKIYSSADVNSLREMLEGVKCEIKEYDAIFKKPCFKDTIELNKSSISANIGGLSFNPKAEAYYKVVKLIKSWTLTDDNGVAIEPTEENIGQLAPGVADTISSQLEFEIGSTY